MQTDVNSGVASVRLGFCLMGHPVNVRLYPHPDATNATLDPPFLMWSSYSW